MLVRGVVIVFVLALVLVVMVVHAERVRYRGLGFLHAGHRRTVPSVGRLLSMLL